MSSAASLPRVALSLWEALPWGSCRLPTAVVVVRVSKIAQIPRYARGLGCALCTLRLGCRLLAPWLGQSPALYLRSLTQRHPIRLPDDCPPLPPALPLVGWGPLSCALAVAFGSLLPALVVRLGWPAGGLRAPSVGALGLPPCLGRLFLIPRKGIVAGYSPLL